LAVGSWCLKETIKKRKKKLKNIFKSSKKSIDNKKFICYTKDSNKSAKLCSSKKAGGGAGCSLQLLIEKRENKQVKTCAWMHQQKYFIKEKIIMFYCFDLTGNETKIRVKSICSNIQIHVYNEAQKLNHYYTLIHHLYALYNFIKVIDYKKGIIIDRDISETPSINIKLFVNNVASKPELNSSLMNGIREIIKRSGKTEQPLEEDSIYYHECEQVLVFDLCITKESDLYEGLLRASLRLEATYCFESLTFTKDTSESKYYKAVLDWCSKKLKAI
jgi:hypothetical protein